MLVACPERGFHHHATMCIAADGFLISERETISRAVRNSCGIAMVIL